MMKRPVIHLSHSFFIFFYFFSILISYVYFVRTGIWSHIFRRLELLDDASDFNRAIQLLNFRFFFGALLLFVICFLHAQKMRQLKSLSFAFHWFSAILVISISSWLMAQLKQSIVETYFLRNPVGNIGRPDPTKIIFVYCFVVVALQVVSTQLLLAANSRARLRTHKSS